MNQPENQTQNKTKKALYDEEKVALIQKEKSIFTKSLKDITVKIESKKSVENFIKSALEEDDPNMPEINEQKEEFIVWFNMKILGVVFMTLYILGLYIYIGFMNSIMEEIKSSAILYLRNIKRNEDETFYDIYNKINQEPPEFELYFLTSNLSNKIIDFLTIYGLTIIDLIINVCIIFGIYNFEFHITPENINNNYSTKQFLYLILMYILLYLSIGLISSLPHNIFNSAFDQYENWKEKRQNKNDNNNQANNNNQENQEKPTKKYNGYWIGYFISILVSMGLKFVFNRFVIIQENGKIKKFYGLLIAFHCVPILLSLLVYIGFSTIFNKKVKSKKKKKSSSSCRFCGYIYYSEEEKNEKEIKCEGCRKGFRKCYYNCFCYKCSCFNCCECLTCCCCCGKEDDLSEVEYREKKVCVIYKTTGKCAWFCDLFTDKVLLILAFMMFLLELVNFGFKPNLSEYLDGLDNSELYKYNLFGLLGILIFYFLTLFSGWAFKKCLSSDDLEGEGSNLGIGLDVIFFPGSVVSFIISIFAYFTDISEEAKHLIMPLSIGSIEFFKILLQNISDGIFKTQAVSFDSLFSIYVIIWNIFAFILDITGVNTKKMILAQFIVSLIVIIFGIFLFVCLLADQAFVKKARNSVDEEHRNAEEHIETERKDINEINRDNNISVYNKKEDNQKEINPVNQIK